VPEVADGGRRIHVIEERPLSETPPLAADEVRVYRIGLDLPSDALEEARATISGEERARADRFRLVRDRDRSPRHALPFGACSPAT
jgi:hypothetical protein